MGVVDHGPAPRDLRASDFSVGNENLPVFSYPLEVHRAPTRRCREQRVGQPQAAFLLAAALIACVPACGGDAEIAWNATIDGVRFQAMAASDGHLNLLLSRCEAGALGEDAGGCAASFTYDGALRWTKVTFPGYDATGAIDPAGNLYQAGHPGSDRWTIVAHGSGGAHRWTRSFGGDHTVIYHAAATTDSDGNLYVAVSSYGDLPHDAADCHYGHENSFVAGYDGLGEPLWSRGCVVQIEGSLIAPTLMASGPGDRLYLASGYVRHSLISVTPEGPFRWERNFDASIADVTTDAAGNVYVLGREGDAVSVASFSPSGAPRWSTEVARFGACQFQGCEEGSARWSGELAAGEEQVYVAFAAYAHAAGPFEGVAAFGGSMQPEGAGLVLVGGLSLDGTYRWSTRVGQGQATASGLAVDEDGGVYLAGEFAGELVLHDGSRMVATEEDHAHSSHSLYLVKLLP